MYCSQSSTDLNQSYLNCPRSFNQTSIQYIYFKVTIQVSDIPYPIPDFYALM